MIKNHIKIDISADSPKSRINPNLFGLHLEHIWNCVYPSVWVGTDSNVPNIHGVRKDVINYLSELHPTICKYPGGYFSDFYDWRDGIGPHNKRHARVSPTQPGKIEPNQFGTAEFIGFCRSIGAEPFLSVNTTSIEPSIAAAWVEYCNGTKNTYWAKMRREHGFDEPFNVTYWAIGNEPYWLHSPEEYANRYHRWVHWMYNTDPSITVVAGGVEPEQCISEPWNTNGKWGETFLGKTHSASGFFPASWHASQKERSVLYSFHPYFHTNMDCTEKEYCTAFSELKERLPDSIKKAVHLLDMHKGENPRPGLCFDEYGLLQSGIKMEGNMTQKAPFWAALWLAAFFHICFEHSEYVSMATLPGTINMEHELLLLEGEELIKTPSYYLFKLFRNHGNSDFLECKTSNLSNYGPDNASPLLCTASIKPNKQTMTVSVINPGLSSAVKAQITITGTQIKNATAQQLYSSDIHASNSPSDNDNIIPVTIPVKIEEGIIEHTFPKHSVTVFNVTTTP